MNKRKNMIIKIFVLVIIIVGVALGSYYSNLNNSLIINKEAAKVENGKRTIVDMDGNNVIIPQSVNRVGTSWPGFCNVVFTVDGNKKMIAAPTQLKKYPWSVKIFPTTADIAYPFDSKLNLEELIQSKPDVVFLRKGDEVEKVKEAGIPVVMIDYTHNNIEDIINAVLLTGKVLGDN